jgi:hypothetical protein
MLGAIAAPLAREYFPLLGRQFGQHRDIFVIDLLYLVPAEATLCLLLEAHASFSLQDGPLGHCESLPHHDFVFL